MDQLKNKVAVVTGGASGIGLGLARRFHAEGVRVAVADVDRSPLHSIHDALDGNVLTKLVDVRDPVAVEAFAEEVFADLGVVHILCNNADVSGASPRPGGRGTLPLTHTSSAGLPLDVFSSGKRAVVRRG